MRRQGFTSNRGNFEHLNAGLIDMILGNMAIDIETGLKVTSGMPVDKGQMKAATRSFRNKNHQHRVEINKVYAAAQEAGIVNGSPIKNYTTPGTSAGFFKRAVGAVWGRRETYVSEARRAFNI